MLAEARDIWATFDLEKHLGALREEYIEAVLAGRSPGADFWSTREEAIRQEIRQTYYTQEMRVLVKTDEAGTMSDEQDYEQRTQTLTEHALFMTHRLLAQIPFHGQAEYREP